ncbi:MAG: Si-specific NAD(P)(+) transhydrogenase [Desulfuromonadales bacterium]|nr:Si-specific NAD(P)(+) transhydrogenase [Desulfuromonadales bacterium]
MRDHYDAIVIGSGPGGEGAAISLAKAGLQVAVIERYLQVGGGCTHWGTIPSKALIHVVRQFAALRRSRLFFRVTNQARLSGQQLMAAVNEIVAEQVREREGFYRRNEVDVIEGHACFVDAHTIEVNGADSSSCRLSANHFVIATGSHPYRPADVDFDSPRVVDSDTILQLTEIPATLTVYGAGVIGSEYASAFREVGSRVNLINTREQLLEFLDSEISNALSYHMADEQGIMIRPNEEYQRVEVRSDGVILHLRSGKQVRSDLLLWANGRTGNSAGLGLETLDIVTDQRGNIPVNDNYQTSQPHIYAVGDIVGFPNLASAAFDQGRFAGLHIADGRSDLRLVAHIPTGIYTSPEIGALGQTESELSAARIPYEVGRAFFRNLARGQITDSRTGMLKLLFHRDSLELLGIHCFGDNAAEILHIGQAIMTQPAPHNSIEYFMNTTFNYPTMAEAYRVAALNGYNRL